MRNLVIDNDVPEAVAAGRLHLWTVEHLCDAIKLVLGVPCWEAGPEGAFPAESGLGGVATQLRTFSAMLTISEGGERPSRSATPQTLTAKAAWFADSDSWRDAGEILPAPYCLLLS